MEKQKEFKKMQTVELFGVDWAKLSATDLDAWDKEINDREPFVGITDEISSLQKAVEELQQKFRKHAHRNDNIYIKEE